MGGCSLQADLSFLGSAGAWPAWSVTASGGGGVRCGQPVPRTCFGTLPAQGPLLFAFHSELPDQCSPDPCDKKGTQVCQDLMGNFYCQCRDGWAGRLCDRGEAALPGEIGVSGAPSGPPRAWAGRAGLWPPSSAPARGHSHRSVSSCDRSEEMSGAGQLCGDTGAGRLPGDGWVGSSASQVLPEAWMSGQCWVSCCYPRQGAIQLEKPRCWAPSSAQARPALPGHCGGGHALPEAGSLSGPPLVGRESGAGSPPPSLTSRHAGSAEKLQ